MYIFYFLVLILSVQPISNAALIYQDYENYAPGVDYEIRNDIRLRSALRTGRDTNGQPSFFVLLDYLTVSNLGKPGWVMDVAMFLMEGKEYIVKHFVIPSL